VVIEFKGRVDEHELMKWARSWRRSPGPSVIELDVQERRTWGRDKVLASAVLKIPRHGECVLATKRLE
jgi:hypothetical protein